MEQSNSSEEDLSIPKLLMAIQKSVATVNSRLDALENDKHKSKRPAEDLSDSVPPKIQKLDNDSYYEEEFKFNNNNNEFVDNDLNSASTSASTSNLDAGISISILDVTNNITPVMPRPSMEVPDYINAIIQNFKTSVGVLGPNFIETEIPPSSVAWLKGLSSVQSFINKQPTKRNQFSSIVVPVVNDKDFQIVWNLIYKNLDFSKVTDNAFRPLKPFPGLLTPLTRIREALRQNLQSILIMHLFIQYCDNEAKPLVERFVYDCSYLQFNNLLDALFHSIISAKKTLTPSHLRNLNCLNNFPEPENIWNLSNNDIITIRRLNTSKNSHFRNNFNSSKPFRGSFRSNSRGFNFRGRARNRGSIRFSSNFKQFNNNNTNKKSEK